MTVTLTGYVPGDAYVCRTPFTLRSVVAVETSPKSQSKDNASPSGSVALNENVALVPVTLTASCACGMPPVPFAAGSVEDVPAELHPARRLWLYTNFDCNLACTYCCVSSSPRTPRRPPSGPARP